MRNWGQEEKGTTEDEMVGWHHRLDGHGFGWAPGLGDGQGGLACCGSWGLKELDMTERLHFHFHSGNNVRLYFLGLQNHCRCDCSHEIKRRLLLGRKVTTNLDSKFKSRHYFGNKGLSSQGYGFSSGHVWM